MQAFAADSYVHHFNPRPSLGRLSTLDAKPLGQYQTPYKMLFELSHSANIAPHENRQDICSHEHRE
jgi:hypothetical protein